jgi:hypothetical protein
MVNSKAKQMNLIHIFLYRKGRRLFIYNTNTIKAHEKYVPLAIIQDENEIKSSLGSIPSFIDEISVYKYCEGRLIFLENLNL